MTEIRHNPEPERIDLGKADDPRDVVHRAVASLAQGEVVMLATAGACGLAASGLHPEAVLRVVGRGGGPGELSAQTLLLKGADEVSDWVPGLSPLASRLARRAWPGPLTIVFDVPPGRGLLRRLPEPVVTSFRHGGGVAVQVPADPFLRDVLRLLPGPVVFRSVDLPLPTDGASLGSIASGACVRLVIESSSGTPAGPATVVRIDARGMTLVRPGLLDEASLVRMSGTILLFVCTGNTCRSPMAEAICKVLLAERLGCDPEELEARGYFVLSAGIAAIAGMPAAANAVDVVKERGGSLDDHASRRLTIDLVLKADLILAMTGDHLETLLEHIPEAAPRTRLLHPMGHDVADPVGSDRETYRRTADAIEEYLRAVLDTLEH